MNLIAKYNIILGALFLLLISGCRKDVDIFTPSEVNTTITTETILSSIGGIVLNEQGLPVHSALITAGNKTASTNENGIFVIEQVQLPKKHAQIIAQKPGYFTNSIAIQPGNNTYISKNEIRLISSTLQSAFESTLGGTYVTENSSLTFSANSFEENGGFYDGTVFISATFIAPDAPLFGHYLTGNQMGVQDGGILKFLKSFGILLLEIQGANGQELNLVANKTFDFAFDVNTELTPTELPLWIQHTESNRWIEESTAMLEGNQYIGSSNKIQAMNIATLHDYVELSGQIHTDQNEGLSYTTYKILSAQNDVILSSHTTISGHFKNLIPIDTDLSLTVYNSCNEILTTHELGVLIEDTEQNITVTNAGAVKIHGFLADCDNTGVDYGYLMVNQTETSNVLFVTDGAFNLFIPACAGTDIFEITGFDWANQEQSSTETFDFSNDINAGDIIACPQLEEYIAYDLDGEQFTISDPSGYQQVNSFTSIWGEDTDTNEKILMFFNGSGNGTYTSVGTDLYANDYNFETHNITTTITAYGEVGGFIIGTFGGTFTDSNGNEHTLNGSYKTIRE